MIKPFSGGFDMDKFFECDCPRCKPELYIINKDERIKELEDHLTAFIDETNRLTAIKKELEQKQMKLNGQCIEYIRKIDKLEQENLKLLEIEEIKAYEILKLRKELERYKAFVKQFYSNGEFEYNDIVYEALKEFEEAKE